MNLESRRIHVNFTVREGNDGEAGSRLAGSIETLLDSSRSTCATIEG